jgi:membrane-associated phospholipid phosphatase
MPETDIAKIRLSLSERIKLRYAFYFIFAVCFITIIDELFGKAVFDMSIEVSKKLQTYNIYSVCYVFSYYLHYLPAPFFAMAPLFKRDKIGSMLNLFSIFLCLWIYSILKLIYADMRPNYISTALRSDLGYCEKDYGKPSGHALFSFTVYLALYRDLKQTFFKKRGYNALLVLVVLIPFMISFSRLYFGVHSINQLILGAAYGVICYLLVDIYAKKIKIFILLPILYPTDFHIDKHIIRRRLLITAFIMNSIHVGVWLFRWLEEGGSESVLIHIVNCLSVKENAELNFSVRLFSQGMLYNLMIAILLGMNEAGENWHLVLDLTYDLNPIFIIGRFVLVGYPLFFVRLMNKISLSNIPMMLVRSFIVYIVAGYTMGRYSTLMMKKLKIPIRKNEHAREGHHRKSD